MLVSVLLLLIKKSQIINYNANIPQKFKKITESRDFINSLVLSVLAWTVALGLVLVIYAFVLAVLLFV